MSLSASLCFSTFKRGGDTISRKLKRFKKGSKEAKRFMAKLRRIKKGTTKRRKRTYRNALYPKRRRRRKKRRKRSRDELI
ncbi:hypothetical protein ES703_82415 [subsurface metagenome]